MMSSGGERMEMNMDFDSVCNKFAQILNGESETQNGSCSVSLHRSFEVEMLGKDASSALEVSVNFQDLDNQGNALNFAEVTVLQEEVPAYLYALVQQGIIVSALHNSGYIRIHRKLCMFIASL